MKFGMAGMNAPTFPKTLTYERPAHVAQNFALIGEIRTRIPYSPSNVFDFVKNSSLPPYSVVTSTSNGAKSSATRCHTSVMILCSLAEKDGLPSVLNGGAAMVSAVGFHAVPEMLCPVKSR